jgi:hypothetical protein
MPLKEKHEKFCQSYVIHRNATKAAIAAGYSEGSAHNQGYRLVHDEAIKERIKELEQGITTDVDVISEIEKQYEAARVSGHGNTALKALELLAKVRGNNSEDVSVDVDTLENDIVYSLQVMGFEKAFQLMEQAFPSQFQIGVESEEELLFTEELSSTTDTETSSNNDT